MTLQYSTECKNARLNALETAVGTAPLLRIYDLAGAAPGSCEAAISGTVLATFQLPTDWLSAASGGSISSGDTWTDTSADNSGTADFFRIYDSGGGTCYVQGSAGIGDVLQLQNYSISSGQIVTISSFGLISGNISSELSLKISSDSRYLIDAKGNPIFIMGDSAWSLISQCTTAEVDTYLTDRASRGFNAVTVQLIDHYFCDNAPNNIYDDAPFTSTNFTTPNEDYFTHADYVINKAVILGICVFLYPLYIGFTGTEEGWDTEIAAASTDDMASWGTYLGNRYKDYPNIIWVLGCDRDVTDWMTKLTACANAIVAADPNHILTIHDVRGNMAVSHSGGVAWCTLNNTYTQYLPTTTLAHTAYDYGTTMPFLQIEAWYETTNSLTDQNLRAQAYWTILGGGCGHVFGHHPLWGFGFYDDNWASTFLNTHGALGMKYCAELFNSKEWQNLVPDYDHAVLTAGYGTEGEADYAACGRVADGSLIMIYMPSNRTMTVDMTKLSGTATCRWYDPMDGSYTTDAASPHANSGTHDFSRASSNSNSEADWILVLEV